ncbi:MAG TPA: type II toxin-antitoxin system VapC family toxin [Deltaproteobacteria bacterium]|nr:type II toxin-antitoxin system VapC family toxin [Deltaproteobacteria bacterium]
MKEYLLDTHTFLWSVSEPSKLSEKASEIIRDVSNVLYLSSASVWEIVIKHSLNRLEKTRHIEDIREFINDCIVQLQVTPLAITVADVLELSKLPYIHKDPFDRILVAQARVHDLTIITKDSSISRYKVRMVW